jgi:hypothetical protein
MELRREANCRGHSSGTVGDAGTAPGGVLGCVAAGVPAHVPPAEVLLQVSLSAGGDA